MFDVLLNGDCAPFWNQPPMITLGTAVFDTSRPFSNRGNEGGGLDCARFLLEAYANLWLFTNRHFTHVPLIYNLLLRYTAYICENNEIVTWITNELHIIILHGSCSTLIYVFFVWFVPTPVVLTWLIHDTSVKVSRADQNFSHFSPTFFTFIHGRPNDIPAKWFQMVPNVRRGCVTRSFDGS